MWLMDYCFWPLVHSVIGFMAICTVGALKILAEDSARAREQERESGKGWRVNFVACEL